VLERLAIPPADPLLALAGLVRMDARPGRIDLGIGVFRDEGGQTPVMRAVAEGACWPRGQRKPMSVREAIPSLQTA
jgi:aspartate/tyrosine/aromatic aminotransferase